MVNEESDDEGYPWPPDMERRRKAALRQFYRNNPGCKRQCEGTNPLHRIVGEHKQGRLRSATSLPATVTERRRTRQNGSRDNERKKAPYLWNLETTLELLEALKAYVTASKAPRLGRNLERWKDIVAHMTIPRGFKRSQVARCAMSKLSELRRLQRQGRLKVTLRQSLLDYKKICDRYITRRAK